MVDKETIYATLIDFVGIILMYLSGFYLPIIHTMLIFPLVCYFITYRYFKEKFWKAFWVSIGFMIVLIIVDIFLMFYAQSESILFRMALARGKWN